MYFQEANKLGKEWMWAQVEAIQLEAQYEGFRKSFPNKLVWKEKSKPKVWVEMQSY